MSIVTTYTIKGRNTGCVWQFKYDLNGLLKSFEILEGELSDQQQKWLFHAARFPYTENACKGLRTINNFEVVIGEADISFMAFWEAYGHKVGKKVQTENSWSRLSKGDKIMALKGIAKYDRYLSRKHGIEKVYPSTYINQRMWENEYSSAN